MKQELTIPGNLPGMNEITQANRGTKGGYWTGSRQKKRYTELVAWEVKRQKIKPCGEMVDFHMTWYVKNRRKDKDNIMAGQKFIFDGLVLAGILPNDGWNEIGNISHSFEVSKIEKVVVEITPSKKEQYYYHVDGQGD